MALTLFVFALLVLVGLWLLGRSGSKFLGPAVPLVAGTLLVALALGIASTVYLKPLEVGPTCLGLTIGTLTSLIAAYSDWLNKRGAVALSLACLVASGLEIAAVGHLDSLCLGCLVGAGAGAAMLKDKTSSLSAIVVSSVALMQLLSHSKTGGTPADFAAGIGVGCLTLVAVVGILVKALPEKTGIWSISCGVAGALGLVAMGKYCFPDSSDWFGLLTAPAAAVIVFWLQKNNGDRQKFGLVLSTVIWIGLATIAFGIERGTGIAVALLMGTGILVILEADRAILSAGPLLGLGLHRAFRLEHSGVGGAIDIGQHYALIGFALAAILPLLPIEWSNLQVRTKLLGRSLGAVLWLGICFATPCLIALFLAPKGLLGFVTGLGFCGFFAFMEKDWNLSVLNLAEAIGGVAILEYGTLQTFTDLARNDKIHWFLVSGFVLVLLGGLLTLLSAMKEPDSMVNA